MSKFWQKKYISKYTGEEIDAAIAKADTVPAVTAADAGSALVVDEEGKIVAGEAGVSFPVFELTDEEFGEVSVAFSTFLYGLTAASGLVYKDFTISTNASTVVPKLKAVVNSGKPFVQYKLPASFGGLSIFGSVGLNGFTTFTIPFAFPAPINKYIKISFGYVYAEDESFVTIAVSAQVITAAS